MGTGVAVASLVLGVGTAVDSREKARTNIRLQGKQQDKADVAEEVQRAEQEASLRESRRQEVREGRVRRAQLVAQSEGQGTSGSSGELGALSALAASIQGNLGFQSGQSLNRDSISGIRDDISGLQDDIVSNQTKQSNNAAVGALAGAAFQASGGFDSVFKAFKPGTPAPTSSGASVAPQSTSRVGIKGLGNTQLNF